MMPPAHPIRARAAVLAVAFLAALPALAALAIFGVIETPDSPGYIAYAAQLRHGLPTGQALLHESPSPITLFRMGGYPAFLATLQTLTAHWRLAAVLLQIAALSALAVATAHTARSLGASARAALTAALLPAIGFGVVVQLCILTDALYAALAAGAALRLAARPGLRTALAAGAMLALATTLREATPILALAYLPLATACLSEAGPGALPLPESRASASGPTVRLACALLLTLPPSMVAVTQLAWNSTRGAGPVLTTSRQTVMVQAVLPLLRHHPDLLVGDDAFDIAARATVGGGEYARIDDLHRHLFDAGLAAPQMAAEANRLYWRAWRSHPLAMLGASVANLRHEFLALPFQPIDTVGALMVYAGWPRPAFDRLNIEWTALRRGEPAAAAWIVADVLTRLLGTVIGLVAITSPWWPNPAAATGQRRRLRGLWFVCAGFVGLYAPVHIEPRYLVPVVPLACVIAACALTRRTGARTEAGGVSYQRL